MAQSMIDKLTNYLMPADGVERDDDAMALPEKVNRSKPVNLHVHSNQSPSLKMLIVAQAKFSEVRTYSDHLKSNMAVVINLTGVDVKMQCAIKDFMDGACYALAGSVQRVSESVFIYVPTNVDISKELYSYSVPTYIKPKL